MIRAQCHWSLWRESTGDRWIPLTQGQLRGKRFHLMTSVCHQVYTQFCCALFVVVRISYHRYLCDLFLMYFRVASLRLGHYHYWSSAGKETPTNMGKSVGTKIATITKEPCAYSVRCTVHLIGWWRHQMGIFSALLNVCDGNPPVTGGFPPQKSLTRSFDVFFDVRLNTRLSNQAIKTQSRRRWFETLSPSLWRNCNDHT